MLVGGTGIVITAKRQETNGICKRMNVEGIGKEKI
jgi:hypothetical protein